LLLFTIAAFSGFYLLTKNDAFIFKQITRSVYGIIGLIFLIGVFVMRQDTLSYVLWVQFFFLFMATPLFLLVIRFIWAESRHSPTWLRYTMAVPVSILFSVTIWICLNAFPVILYVF
jgi:hypothetical protein